MISQKGPWVFNNDLNSGYLDIPYLVLERYEKHYFRKYRGFAISKDVYDYAIDRNIQFYEIHYLPDMKVLIYNLQDFRSGYKVMFSGEIQYILPSCRAIREFHVWRFTPQHIPESMEAQP
jgi:hypothetical protein